MINILHIEINEILCLENHFNRLDDHGGVEGDLADVGEDLLGDRVFPGRGSPGSKEGNKNQPGCAEALRSLLSSTALMIIAAVERMRSRWERISSEVAP